MIFEILDFDPDEINDSHRIVLENLACSYYEARHLVFAKTEVAEKLVKISNFSDRARGCYKKIKNAIPQIGCFVEEAKLKVDIDFTGNTNDIFASKSGFKVSYNLFLSSEALQKTHLLCENSTDSNVFLKIADFFLYSKGWSSFGVNFEIANGGGGSTCNEFNRLISNNPLRFCFCILDSDKPHPHAPIGGTASSFPSENKVWNGEVCIMECHELEILLPFKMFNEIFQENKNLYEMELVELIERLCYFEKHFFEFVIFADLKEGMRCKDLVELDRKHGAFWTNISATNLPIRLKECMRRNSCCENLFWIFPKVPTSISQGAIRRLAHKTCMKIGEQLSDNKRDFWKSLGEKIFWWGCALKKPVFA